MAADLISLFGWYRKSFLTKNNDRKAIIRQFYTFVSSSIYNWPSPSLLNNPFRFGNLFISVYFDAELILSLASRSRCFHLSTKT
uniref:Uncharacterized protein n=1 Tax=Solanum lycopersicum TaxID=4081 RepID=K4B585_SOLLC